VRWGKGLIRASGSSFAKGAPAVPVDIFVRPEQLYVSKPDETSFVIGKFAGRVFQGGHCDVYIDNETCVSGRLVARIPAHAVDASWPSGADVGLSLTCGRVIAFAVP
jgi:hypothetical protein